MKIQFKRIDHVQICIPKGTEARGRAFYCGILGLDEIEKPEALKKNGGFWLKAGDIQIHIGTEDMAGKSKRHPAFEIENLEAVRAYLESNGVRVKENTPIPGVKRISIFDFWDNRIELLEREA